MSKQNTTSAKANKSNLAQAIATETARPTKTEKSANNGANTDTLEEVNKKAETISALAHRIMLSDAIATTPNGKSQFARLVALLKGNDKTKDEADYFDAQFDAYNLEFAEKDGKVSPFSPLLSRWCQGSKTKVVKENGEKKVVDRTTFISRIIKEDTTDPNNTYYLLDSPVVDLSTVASNLHSHYAYSVWKEGARRRVAMREVKGLATSDLQKLLEIAKANGMIL